MKFETKMHQKNPETEILFTIIDHHSFITWFFTYYFLKMASKIGNISKFTKELEIFTNWTVDGTQYTYHKNWL